MLLTIGQLAEACGVTVRAVRHYHRIGLLPEPQRDRSGYRRYGTKAVVGLIRIKVLAEAGVPLSRVRQLLEATPGEFADAVTDIDRALGDQIADIEHRRRQLAGLVAGDRLTLPPEVAELIDELRSMGASERAIALERNGWILMEALCPELVIDWARHKMAALAEPDFRRVYLACDEVWDLDAGDPRLDEVAVLIAGWARNHPDHSRSLPAESVRAHPGVSLVEQLMGADSAALSPAWRRLTELSNVNLLGAAHPTANARG